MWTWLLKFLPKVSPLAEAQKLHYETQITLLKSEHENAIEKLKTENRNLRLEVERLKEELGKRPEPVHSSELSEVETLILVCIAKNEEPSHTQIAEEVGLTAIKLRFHVTELERRQFIDDHWNYGASTCTIRHEGLQYLNDRNLLN
jgi:regulator of replication initiation timing